MKNLINCVWIIFLITFTISCTKQDDSAFVETSLKSYNKETIQDAPVDAKIAYQNYHLLKIAMGSKEL
jgi:hypothetical protein